MTTVSLFISSVQKELQEERRVAKAFVEGDPLLRRYFRAFLFEDLTASDRFIGTPLIPMTGQYKIRSKRSGGARYVRQNNL